MNSSLDEPSYPATQSDQPLQGDSSERLTPSGDRTDDVASVSSRKEAEIRKQRTASALGAAIRLLPKIARSLHWQQREDAAQLLRQAADLVAAQYPAIAKSIDKQLPARMVPQRLVARPDELLSFREARHGLDSVVVSEDTAKECRQILEEHSRRDDLQRFKLEPRHKILLSGPPGNGKTMLAEAFAFELDVPYLLVKPSGILESYLGNTGKNLGKVFEYAATGPCVLFFDEFEGVSKQRGSGDDVGEMHRVTNQLLIFLDQLPSHVTFICATNLGDLIDKAVRRRFDFHLTLGAPSESLREELAKRELHRDLTPGHDLSGLVPAVVQTACENLHAVTELCRRLRRELALYGRAELAHVDESKETA